MVVKHILMGSRSLPCHSVTARSLWGSMKNGEVSQVPGTQTWVTQPGSVSGKLHTASKHTCSYSCCCSVAQLCPTLCDPIDCSTPGFPVLHCLLELAQIHVELMMPSNCPILWHPLLLLPSIFPNIRVLSNELGLRIRWPKSWNFSFSISPSNEYSGSVSFSMDWFDLLAIWGALKRLLQHN